MNIFIKIYFEDNYEYEDWILFSEENNIYYIIYSIIYLCSICIFPYEMVFLISCIVIFTIFYFIQILKIFQNSTYYDLIDIMIRLSWSFIYTIFIAISYISALYKFEFEIQYLFPVYGIIYILLYIYLLRLRNI